MKNIKLKYFAVVLMMVLQWSCAKTDIPEASEQISKTDLSGEGSILKEYKTFKIDGVITSDTKKITAMMNNSQVVIDSPEEKEISFYTSEASYRRFNPEVKQDEKASESVQATAAVTGFSDTFNDIGNFGSNLNGVVGLGDILDQGYFRNYALNIYFVNTVKSNGTKNFIRINNLSSLSNAIAGVSVNGSTANVSKLNFYMSGVLDNIKSGTTLCGVKNDTNANRIISFYENAGYGGRVYQLRIPKDAYYSFAPTFSTIGGTCRSINTQSTY